MLYERSLQLTGQLKRPSENKALKHIKTIVIRDHDLYQLSHGANLEASSIID